MFRKPLVVCHDAAVHALTVLGFEVTADRPDYLEGVRPRKTNLIWGNPGGERVQIWLKPADEEGTRVIVTTQKAVAGYIGQKNWDRDVLQQMSEELR